MAVHGITFVIVASGGRYRLRGTEGFATAYDKLLAHIRANPFRSSASVEFMPGSLGWAIEKFFASPLYTERAKTTKLNYKRVLDQLRDGYGAGLLRDLEPRHIRRIRNEIAAKSYDRRRHRNVAHLDAVGVCG
jgi:hypothetical protein